MDYSNYRISLDIHGSASQALVRFNQFDTARKIHFVLTEDGKTFRVPADCTAILSANLPAETPVSFVDDCYVDAETGTVIYEIPDIDSINNILTTYVGTFYAQLTIFGRENQVLSSPKFTIDVREDIGSTIDLDTTDQFGALVTIYEDMQDIRTAYHNGEFDAIATDEKVGKVLSSDSYNKIKVHDNGTMEVNKITAEKLDHESIGDIASSVDVEINGKSVSVYLLDKDGERIAEDSAVLPSYNFEGYYGNAIFAFPDVRTVQNAGGDLNNKSWIVPVLSHAGVVEFAHSNATAETYYDIAENKLKVRYKSYGEEATPSNGLTFRKGMNFEGVTTATEAEQLYYPYLDLEDYSSAYGIERKNGVNYFKLAPITGVPKLFYFKNTSVPAPTRWEFCARIGIESVDGIYPDENFTMQIRDASTAIANFEISISKTGQVYIGQSLTDGIYLFDVNTFHNIRVTIDDVTYVGEVLKVYIDDVIVYKEILDGFSPENLKSVRFQTWTNTNHAIMYFSNVSVGGDATTPIENFGALCTGVKWSLGAEVRSINDYVLRALTNALKKEKSTDDLVASIVGSTAGLGALSQLVLVLKNRAGTTLSTVNIPVPIPSDASADNPLATRAFVNSSVQTATANFRGNWTDYANVPTDDDEYPPDYTASRTPTVHDYLVVQDASDYDDDIGGTYEGTWRFKYTGVWATDGKNGWHPEYQVNETPLTDAQLAALNSGVTSARLSTIESNIAGKLDKVTTHSVLYGTNGAGEQRTYNINTVPTMGHIPQYGNSGALAVGTPTSDSHAVTKSYADSKDIEVIFG